MKACGMLFAMLALIGTMAAAPVFAATRQYYIAAEDGTWDFAPSGKNLVHCHPDAAPCDIPEPWTDSHIFPVTRYIQYTDAHQNIRGQVLNLEWSMVSVEIKAKMRE